MHSAWIFLHIVPTQYSQSLVLAHWPCYIILLANNEADCCTRGGGGWSFPVQEEGEGSEAPQTSQGRSERAEADGIKGKRVTKATIGVLSPSGRHRSLHSVFRHLCLALPVVLPSMLILTNAVWYISISIHWFLPVCECRLSAPLEGSSTTTVLCHQQTDHCMVMSTACWRAFISVRLTRLQHTPLLPAKCVTRGV